MNRCFEALERADLSQALDSALQPPRPSLAFLGLANSLLNAACEAGNVRSYQFGWQVGSQRGSGPWLVESRVLDTSL